ncbi:LysM peptidoglycan-binding domain-containing protein [Streptacidiphilus sp. P02-A3a]|uniref:CIS tube protein n=1 Tax=Streptacidiphilus sp. P02-A3a TaxID=2704468 RepID=UPI0015F9E29E|nr:LysM peptidoglycan-binding domain-containing protein [Streptacidiphilus sp. P02-A3a]QMU70999.1 LysM peptidoglycan-binding domain-containing protein [Streptacidiphilus sp. P02-A3a]
MTQPPGSSLVRASLAIHEPPSGLAMALGGEIGTVDFQFNPNELTLIRRAEWKQDHAVGFNLGSIANFRGVEAATMDLVIFLDGTAPGNKVEVQSQVELLLSCCEVYPPSIFTRRPSPPWVRLTWGSFSTVQFIAYVSSATAKYSLFSPTGEPLRATCTLALNEVAVLTGGQNPTSGALTARRVHRVVAGDSLQSLAWREYGDATVWRVIAEANDIDDPMQLEPGTELLLPAAEEIDR